MADKKAAGFTAEEKAAMRERAKELKAKQSADAEAKDAATQIAKLPANERKIAETIQAIIEKVAPGVLPKTWYGMPAWARDGETICFFQSATKFKTRYATFGFSDKAKLDDGNIWPNSYAITTLDAGVEKRLAELIKKAAG